MTSDTDREPHATLVAAAVLVLLLIAIAVVGARTADDPVEARPTVVVAAPSGAAAAVAAVTHDLRPVAEPLAPRLTGAVVAIDLGLDPAAACAAADELLRASSPELWATAAARLGEFTRWSGLDAERDLYPHLGRDITLALLRASDRDTMFPLPRPLLVLRVTNPTGVREFLELWTRWKAGAVAPATGGLVGATPMSGRTAGHEWFGFDVDGPASIPRPTPTVVILGDLVVASPSRTAALEAASSLADSVGGHH